MAVEAVKRFIDSLKMKRKPTRAAAISANSPKAVGHA
jgi:hypothetical protein